MRVDLSACSKRVYLDTNIFIYAIDSHDPVKHQIAKGMVDSLLQRRLGCFSAQVLSEWRSVMVRKYADKVSSEFRSGFLLWLSSKGPLPVSGELICRADGLAGRYGLSPYDSMQVQAALDLGCRYFLSEDMKDGLVVDGCLEIINPFVT